MILFLSDILSLLNELSWHLWHFYLWHFYLWYFYHFGSDIFTYGNFTSDIFTYGIFTSGIFTYILFNRLLLQTRENQGLFGKGLICLLQAWTTGKIMCECSTVVSAYTLYKHLQ